jgi:hypothetical protein
MVILLLYLPTYGKLYELNRGQATLTSGKPKSVYRIR